MTGYRRWGRSAVGAVVGLKIVAVVPMLVAMVTGGDPGKAASAAPPPALAAQSTSVGDSQGTTSFAARAEPGLVSGEAPSARFVADNRAVHQLVEALRRREAELTKQGAALQQREVALGVATKDLDEKAAHLEALTGQAARDAPEPAAPMEHLGKIYGAMKAEEAAPLFDRLDTSIVRAIFKYMKQRQISAVLPLMDRDKAVALTELLGGRRSVRNAGRGESKRP